MMICLLAVPQTHADPIDFIRLQVKAPYRLEKSFHPEPYFGLIQSRKKLSTLWNHLVHAEDEGFITLHAPPEMPEVDFSKFAVLWFADHGAKASFTELQSLNAHSGVWTATLRVTHSDFGSRRLNLWRIPRPESPLTFQEKHVYDRGP